MLEIEVYPREILEVEHAGEAVGDACRIDGRAGLEEEAQAGHVGELRGVIERLEATGDGPPVVSGRSLELVDVGARLEEHPGQLGIVGDAHRPVEAGLYPRLGALDHREVRVDVRAPVEEEAYRADNARGARGVTAEKAREARVENGLAIEGAASRSREVGMALEQPGHVLGRPAHARGVEVEALQRGLGGEEDGGLAHVPRAGCPHEGGGPLAGVEQPRVNELLPARPAGKAVLPRDDELGVVEGDSAAGSREARMKRAKALHRGAIALAKSVEKGARLLLVEFQGRSGRDGPAGHGRPPSWVARGPQRGR